MMLYLHVLMRVIIPAIFEAESTEFARTRGPGTGQSRAPSSVHKRLRTSRTRQRQNALHHVATQTGHLQKGNSPGQSRVGIDVKHVHVTCDGETIHKMFNGCIAAICGYAWALRRASSEADTAASTRFSTAIYVNKCTCMYACMCMYTRVTDQLGQATQVFTPKRSWLWLWW